MNGNVYYVNQMQSSRAFSRETLAIFSSNNFGTDVTAIWKRALADASPTLRTTMQSELRCINSMFYIGTVDTRESLQCSLSGGLLFGASIVLVVVIGIKFLAALQFGTKKEPEQNDKFIIMMVPCYTEGVESLTKTIDSLSTFDYNDKRKLLFVICDGMIIGSGNDRPTPRIVLDILGVDPNQDPDPQCFHSLGEGNKQYNMGKVYSGLYDIKGRSVPFIVVVKCGSRTERVKPGNRGKRDSQLILMRFLNRVHFNSDFSPMELEIYHQMKNVIGVSPSYYEFILMVDADTEAESPALNRMISVMVQDSKIMGLCGETRIANEKKSWVTMIQV
jgi:chitin synthase